MAATTPMLSQWNSIFVLESRGPHTAQHWMIGANPFDIIPVVVQSEGHFHCSHHFPNSASQPQDPEATLWMELGGGEVSSIQYIRLTPFHE